MLEGGMSYLINLLGGFDSLMQILLTVMALDVISRLSSVIYFRKFNYKTFLMWFVRNIGIMVVIVLAQIFNQILPDEFLRDVVIYTFVINKVVVILDMWKNMGLKYPSILNTTLEKIKQLKENV